MQKKFLAKISTAVLAGTMALLMISSGPVKAATISDNCHDPAFGGTFWLSLIHI